MKQNVLVTGGAGFIGSHVAKWLVKAGYRVVLIDDLSGGFVENIPKGAEFVKRSVQDATFVNALFEKEKFDYVFHLAAYAAEGLSHFIKNFNYQNNLVGSVNLVNAAVNVGTVKCSVFTSSIAVHNEHQDIADPHRRTTNRHNAISRAIWMNGAGRHSTRHGKITV